MCSICGLSGRGFDSGQLFAKRHKIAITFNRFEKIILHKKPRNFGFDPSVAGFLNSLVELG
jgi:hypothetical protein